MKDPAFLFYYDVWYAATMEMKANERGYYLDLLIHQYNKGSLPNDIEELANICRVRISEYKSFEHVFEHVLKQKFKQNDNGRLENAFASDIMRKRENYKEKRSYAGKISYLIRYGINEFKLKTKEIDFIKDNLTKEDLEILDTKDEQSLNTCLNKFLNILNEDVNVIEDINKDKYMTKDMFEMFWDKYPKKTDKKKAKEKFLKLDSELFNTIMYALDYQIQSKQWKEGFIPNPTTWINGERWEDKLESNKAEDTKIKRLTDEDFEGGEYAKFYK